MKLSDEIQSLDKNILEREKEISNRVNEVEKR